MGTSFSFTAAAAVLIAVACATSCRDAEPERAPRRQDAATANPTFEQTESGFVTTALGWSGRVTGDGTIELAARGAGTSMLTLRTVAIGRGVTARAPAVGVAPRRDGVVVARGVAEERITRSESGLEQAWLFAEAPSGDGPLELTVAVDGAQLAGADDRGLRWHDAAHGVRYRYGHATWIDGTGERTSVPARGSEGAITITVDAATVAESTYPAVLDPIVEVETVLDPSPVYLSAPEVQHRAAVATDGTDGLVAWLDERDAPFEIFGTGVDESGQAHQPAGVRLAPSGSFDPRVAYLGTDQGDRKFVVVTTNMFEIFAIDVTMSTTGEITAAEPVVVYTPAPGVFAGVRGVAASPANGHYLVLLDAGNAGGADVLTLVVGTDHQPITTPQSIYEPEWPTGYQSRVAFLTSSYVVLSRDNASSALRARVVSPATGLPTSSFEVTAEASGATNPTIAFNGTTALAAWVDRRVADEEHIWARRLTEAGTASAEFEVGGNPGTQWLPHVIPGDAAQDDFFVVWLDDRTTEGELVGGSVSATNTVTRFDSGTVVRRPHGARIGGAPLIVYDDGFGDPPGEATDVWSRDFAGAWVAPRVIGEQPNEQTAAAVDSDGTSGLIAWSDTRNGRDQPDIFAVTVDQDGAPVGAPIAVSTDPDILDEVDVASSGGESVVVWRRGDDTASNGVTTDIVAALVDGSGSVVDTVVVATGSVNLHPRVIRNGSDYLVTWQTGVFSCEAFCQLFEAEPSLVTLTVSGSSLSVGATITAAETGLSPTLARSGDGDVVWAWEHAGDIHATRVAGGSVGATLTISSGPGRQSRPAVATDGDITLVAFEDDRDGGSQVFAALLAADDSVTDLGSVSGTVEAREPEVVDADDGYSFLAVWEGSAFGAPDQVWGAWIKKTGVLADPVPLELTQSTAGASRRPDVAALGGGRMIIGLDAVGSERSERARSLVVDSGAEDGESCGADNECASRFCADGVCCTVPCSEACHQCGADGMCNVVTNQNDDSCFDRETCNADGECLPADGETCDEDENCASGFCVGNVCCDTECAGECDKCTGGQCVPQACGNFGCHEDKTCRETCSESRHCLEGFQCVDGDCVTPPGQRIVDPGCACHLGERHASRLPLLAMWAGAALALARRRNRAPKTSPRVPSSTDSDTGAA